MKQTMSKAERSQLAAFQVRLIEFTRLHVKAGEIDLLNAKRALGWAQRNAYLANPDPTKLDVL